MVEYTKRYKFIKIETEQLPTTEDVTDITDEKFKIDIDTKEIILKYRLKPEAIPVLSIPLVYDDLTKSFKITKYARMESLAMGYYYATEPSALTTTQPDYLRIDSDRSLITKARLQAWDGSNWVSLRVQSTDYPNLRVSIYSSGSIATVRSISSDGLTADITALATQSNLYAFNGSTWDRLRTEDPAYPNLRVCLAHYDSIAVVGPFNADNLNQSYNKLGVMSFLTGFNGSTYDRIRTHMTMDLGTFTATGAGSSIDTVTGFDKWTWVIITDASATSATVRLEGSIDNEYWFALDEWTGTGNTMRHVVNKPVRYIRANVVDMGDATSITVKAFGMR